MVCLSCPTTPAGIFFRGMRSSGRSLCAPCVIGPGRFCGWRMRSRGRKLWGVVSVEHGFVFQPSHYAAIRSLPDAERLKMYDALVDYGVADKMPEELPPILNGYFLLIKPGIDKAVSRFLACAENGKKGGRPPKKPKRKPKRKARANPAKRNLILIILLLLLIHIQILFVIARQRRAVRAKRASHPQLLMKWLSM